MNNLLSIWLSQKDTFESKNLVQILNFAGDGKLKDGNETSIQLRELFANIPTSMLNNYVFECLTSPFQDSGLVLQDLVNEVGRRLGFKVDHGMYRGKPSAIGFDGIWRAKDGYAFVANQGVRVLENRPAYIVE